MTNKKDKGFTLVELLIVIVILGILATVTVFAVRGITARSQTNSCDVEKRALDTAIEAYYVDTNQTFPATLGALAPRFIKSDPNPATGQAVWTYTAAADGSGYTLVPATGGKCVPPTP